MFSPRLQIIVFLIVNDCCLQFCESKVGAVKLQQSEVINPAVLQCCSVLMITTHNTVIRDVVLQAWPGVGLLVSQHSHPPTQSNKEQSYLHQEKSLNLFLEMNL